MHDAPPPTPTCAACCEAHVNAACHSFNANCLRCTERHFAHLPMLWECRQLGYITEVYKTAMVKQFGVDGFAAAHAAVKDWVDRIKQARGIK